MTTAERTLLEALTELDRAAASIKSGQARPNLGGILTRIDDLAAALPSGTDPRLRHYLERKSYEKARLHLQESGGEIAPGGCG
jgi:hypothetical protein